MRWTRGRVGREIKDRFVQGRSRSADRVSTRADHCCSCCSALFLGTISFRSSPFQARFQQPIRRRVAPFKTLAEATSYNSYPSCWLMPENPGTSLQADCLPDIRVNSTAQHNLIQQTDLDVRIRAAGVMGDDRMRRMARGHVRPESCSHGSSAHRPELFERGLRAATSLKVMVLRGDDPGNCGTVIRKAHEGDGW